MFFAISVKPPLLETIVIQDKETPKMDWAQFEGSLEERGLHAVYLLKTLIWAFAIMLVLQSIYIISQGLLKLFRKYY